MIAPTDGGTQQSLTLWLAPEFAPDSDTNAGALLAERLAAFQASRPGLSLVVRIKDQEGPAGLLSTLKAASIAAPSALPDLISLDTDGLADATNLGLSLPLTNVMANPSSPEWYDFALSATRIEGSFYGLAFAGWVDLLAYRTEQYEGPPTSWNQILAGPPAFIFPAADDKATFTLAQYLSLGGGLSDSAGSPALDPAILADVLAFYASARAADVLPLTARQYTSSAETWKALQEGRASSAVAPLNDFLPNQEAGALSAIPLPTRAGAGVCFTDTWSWAIVARQPDRQTLSAELLEWLIQAEFLGAWTLELRSLPPTQSALSAWPEGMHSAVVGRLVTACQPAPPSETLAIFGPPLEDAVEAVLGGGTTPESAALEAAQAVGSTRRPES